jgi:hypothetical protein
MWLDMLTSYFLRKTICGEVFASGGRVHHVTRNIEVKML